MRDEMLQEKTRYNVPAGSEEYYFQLHRKRKAKGNFVILYDGFYDVVQKAADQAESASLTYRLFLYFVEQLEYPIGNYVPCNVKAIAKHFALTGSSIYAARKALIDVDMIRKFRGKLDGRDPLYKNLYKLQLVELNPHYVFAGKPEDLGRAIAKWNSVFTEESNDGT